MKNHGVIVTRLLDCAELPELHAGLKALLALGLDYASAGTLEFLDWNSPPRVLPDSYDLTWKRALSLAEKMAEFRFVEIVEDHLSDGGYLTSMCSPGSSGPTA